MYVTHSFQEAPKAKNEHDNTGVDHPYQYQAQQHHHLPPIAQLEGVDAAARSAAPPLHTSTTGLQAGATTAAGSSTSTAPPLF